MKSPVLIAVILAAFAAGIGTDRILVNMSPAPEVEPASLPGRDEDILEADAPPSPEDLKARIADHSSRAPQDREPIAETYHRLAETDPAAALELLLAEPDFTIQSEAIGPLFHALASRDFAAAKAALERLQNPELRERALHAMAEGAGLKDPQGFARYLETLPDGHHVAGFFQEWALRDPAAATAFAASAENPLQRQHWTQGAARGYARQSPTAALEWLNTLSGSPQFWAAAEPALHEITRSEPSLAAVFLQDLPSSPQRSELVGQLAHHWARRDRTAALERAGSLSGTDASNASFAIAEQWIQDDPPAAANYLASLPPSERTLDLVHHLSNRWTGSDPAAAIGWALDQSPQVRRRALEGASTSWASTDPSSAAAFALELENPAERRTSVQAIARQWSRQDLTGAIAWAESLPGDLRPAATSNILAQLSHHAPRDAAAVYEMLTTTSVPEHRADIAAEIAGNWSEAAPAEAISWATTLQNEEARHRATESAAHHWVRSDPIAASEWISQLPSGNSRDAAAAQLIEHIAPSDPDAAFQWSLTLQNHDRQTELLHHVFENWSQSDPAAASNALQSAPLTADQRERLSR